MLEIELNKGSGTNLSTQLQAALVYLVRSGSLAPGDKLPAIRDLARELQVNRNTVQAVYNKLVKQEYFVSRAGDGTYVAQQETSEKVESEQLARRKLRIVLSDVVSMGIDMEDVRAIVHYELLEIAKEKSQNRIDSIESKHRFSNWDRHRQ